MTLGMDPEDVVLATVVMATPGAVHEMLSGNIANQEIFLDGKVVRNASLENCKIRVSSGNFLFDGSNTLTKCGFTFEGLAGNLYDLFKHLDNNGA